MTAGVAVELKDLSRHYGPVRALDGLTLRMEPGQLVALLGPSGCGKTTALRILAGLDEASAGSVWVDGRDISRVPANKRDIGMVFQAYSLFPHLTVRDNVAFGLKMRGIAKRDRLSRALEMLDLVGLAAQSDRYAGELSGGQQQRVALARALAIQPRVLLLDEPLSALDAKVRTQLRDEIRRVQQEVGITTLFVTHDQEEALAIADRVGVMNAGRLEQLAAPADLYTAPATPFVAEFVGLSNRVPAEVIDGRVLLWGRAVPALPGSVTGAGTALVRPEAVRLAAGASEATGLAGGASGATGLAGGASGATGLAGGASGATGLAGGASGATGLATVQSVSFLGAVSRVRVALAGSEASGSEAGATVLAQVGGGASFTVGQRVRVSVESDGVLVV
ncbi:ABC transporter ATP-binding protein [Mycolicibacterium sp. J2]|uniref:ABC transporter ATP-binding protein n=1 Tax=Mycolicibacterium sp. J2 TaxID=2993511 RepID=UPI00224B50E7|nr:ABC transporter ATP-binding protein [Mycolicibacterium sp. J2]MCX2712951.1 ABC transporter ATP-binding protein [Mycolicibacterium sp. J2]